MSNENKPRSSGGRPPGKPFPVLKQIRLTAEDAEELQALVLLLRTTEAEVLRRGLRLLSAQTQAAPYVQPADTEESSR